MTQQVQHDTITQFMSDLKEVRRQLAQVRQDLERLEATHFEPKPKPQAPKTSFIARPNPAKPQVVWLNHF